MAPQPADGIISAEQRREIVRRADLAKGLAEVGMPDQAGFDRAAGIGNDPPFRADDQQWVLFSVAHAEMPPRPARADAPALRVLGCFPDADSAVAHAELVRQADPGCNLQLDRTHQWVLACRSPARLADPAHVEGKRARLLAAHAAALVSARRDFEETKSRMMQDDRPMVVDGDAPSDSDDDDAADADDAAAVARARAAKAAAAAPADGRRAQQVLPATCELSGQRVACVCFVPDTEEPEAPEFLFQVLGCFATDAEADRYVRNVAAAHISEHDIDLVQAVRWVFPTADLKEVKHEYRSSELTAIMQEHASQPAKVAQARREFEAGGAGPAAA